MIILYTFLNTKNNSRSAWKFKIIIGVLGAVELISEIIAISGILSSLH